MPMESHLIAVKRILRYLKYIPCLGLWYPKGTRFQLVGYFNSDYVRCRIDRKSTSDGCHFLGRSLVPWMSKKYSVALSTAKAEYIAAGACYAQILYMKQTLLDCGVVLHHFLRDHVAKGDISLENMGTENQLADISRKPLYEARFVCWEMNLMCLISLTSLKMKLCVVLVHSFCFAFHAYQN